MDQVPETFTQLDIANVKYVEWKCYCVNQLRSVSGIGNIVAIQ